MFFSFSLLPFVFVCSAVKELPYRPPMKKEKKDEENDDVDDDDPFSVLPTPEQTIAVRILDRARNFVPCKVVEAQLDALACLGSCLEVRPF